MSVSERHVNAGRMLGEAEAGDAPTIVQIAVGVERILTEYEATLQAIEREASARRAAAERTLYGEMNRLLGRSEHGAK